MARWWTWAVTVALLVTAIAVGWTAPETVGDLRPSPDAVEYGLAAVSLARLEAPALRIGEVSAPPRYPFGFPLLAAPFVRLGSPAGTLQPHAAVLATLACGVVLAGLLWQAGRRAFGALAGALAVLLTLCSPFYVTYSREVMAELPSATFLAAMAAVLVRLASARRPLVLAWGVGLGLLLAGAMTVRLSNAQVAPAAALGLMLALSGRRELVRGLAGLLAGGVAGLAPLLAYNWRTFGGSLTTGYHLWTPEWANGSRPAFSLGYAFGLPALPGGAVQPNAVHYLASWIGWPAVGDGGQAVGSPVHASLAAGLALLACLGLWGGLSTPRRAARAVSAFTVAGVTGGFVLYALYFYQDVRYLTPWVPLWLLLAAAGAAHWPAMEMVGAHFRAGAPSWLHGLLPIALTGVAVLALAPLPDTIAGAPLWQRLVRHRPAGVNPRLAQMQALAHELPPDAWIISAIDGPLLEHHVLQGTQRRYLPLARGLEFVDKPPFRSVSTAQEQRAAILARTATATAIATATATAIATATATPGQVAAVVVDRWSLEFAEAWPGYRRELERALAGFDLLPGGSSAPFRPSFYLLAPERADHGLAQYALQEGKPLRGSADAIYVYDGGMLRHVPSLQVFADHGLRWDDVRRLPDLVLSTIPQGAVLE